VIATIVEYPEVYAKIVSRVRVYYDAPNTTSVEMIFTDQSRLSLRFNLLFQHEGSLYSSGTITPEDELEDFLVRRHGPVLSGVDSVVVQHTPGYEDRCRKPLGSAQDDDL
jgi:hypothetical protein